MHHQSCILLNVYLLVYFFLKWTVRKSGWVLNSRAFNIQMNMVLLKETFN